MKKLFAVIKGELRRYFASPLAVVYLICFLALNSSFSLYFGGIFSKGNASLRPMFDFMPWLYLLFVSGIAMRLWAEEFKSKTVLQIMTMPVSINTYVWGKFLAAWSFCALGLLLTFPFVITINILGNPDNGVIFNSYFGALVLAGAMLAIAQTASAMTKNQVIALVISVIINLLFFLCGLEYVLGFLRKFTSEYFVETVASFSFLTHIAKFNSGLLQLNGLVFFVVLIVIFNSFTAMIVACRTSGVTPLLKLKSLFECVVAALLIVVAFTGINLFSNNSLSGYRIDWTAEKLFTPAKATKDILRNLAYPVTVKVYYSKLLGERDEDMRLNFENLKNILQTYQATSKGKLTYRIYDVEPLSEEEDRAIAEGLQGLPVPDLNAAAYFGLVINSDNGNSRVIPFLPKQRQLLLEQDIMENIYLLEHKALNLGVFTSLPMFGETVVEGILSSPWQIIDELKKYYNVKEVKTEEDLADIDLLMMVHPQNMSETMEDAIYNFSISGGKVLAFFDIMPEALELINSRRNVFFASDYGTLPARWGFHFYDDMVVADLANSTQVSIDVADYAGTVQDLIQFYITEDNMFDDVPETQSLKRLLVTSASVFMPLKDSLIYFVPLLQASTDSTMMSSQVVSRKIHPAEILRYFKADDKAKYIAAHILSQKEGAPFELIVVGDTDMLYDSFWTTNIQIGKETYRIPLLDNANFVLNALEVLSGNEKLLSLRGKSPKIRPFTTIEQHQKQVLRDYKVKEKDVFDQIAFIKQGLKEIFSKKDFEQRENFTPEELSLIGKMRRNLADKKQELYDIRTDLNKYMEQVEFWVKLFNIYLLPLLIVVGVIVVNRCKIRPIKIKWRELSMRLAWLTLISAIVFGVGLYSYYERRDESRDVKGHESMFADLEKKINDVGQIKIKNNKAELVFVKKDDVWKLKGREEFLVDQNRIRNFLNALREAKLYEKKAEKIENMANFGIRALEDENSTMTQIELDKANGNYILSFDVGDYNVDLGRGAMGAYIKLPDQFQVWLAKVELVDLNTDYHYWTFANLWNLQLGRIVDINAIGNKDKIAQIVSLLMNVQLHEKIKPIGYEDLVMSLNVQGEYFDRLILDFFKKDDKYYVHFDFGNISNHNLLQKFAQHMKGFYEVKQEDMEKIISVVDQEKE